MASAFSAFVLTGGRSARMGQDKALLRVDGTAMAARVVSALLDAGATSVACVGGDVDGLTRLGLEAIADEHDGAGPLGGVLQALTNAAEVITLVAPCDLLEPRGQSFRVLVDALAGQDRADVAVPVIEGQWRPLPLALRVAISPRVEAAFAAGERAVHRVIAGLVRVEVHAGPLSDADTPEDLQPRR